MIQNTETRRFTSSFYLHWLRASPGHQSPAPQPAVYAGQEDVLDKVLRVIKEQVQGAKGTGVGHQQHPGFAQPEALFWAQEQAPVMDGVAPDCILPMARTPGLAHLVISHLSPECQVLSPITCHLPDCLGGKVHFHILTIPHLVHLNVGHPPAAKWYPEHAQKISHGTGEGWKLGLPITTSTQLSKLSEHRLKSTSLSTYCMQAPC